ANGKGQSPRPGPPTQARRRPGQVPGASNVTRHRGGMGATAGSAEEALVLAGDGAGPVVVLADGNDLLRLGVPRVGAGHADAVVVLLVERDRRAEAAGVEVLDLAQGLDE